MKTSGNLNLLIGPLMMIAIVVSGIFFTSGVVAIEIVINAVMCIALLILWMMSGAAIGRLIVLNRNSLFGVISRIGIGIGILGIIFHLLGLAGLLNQFIAGGSVLIGAAAELSFLVRYFRKHRLEGHATSWIGWIVLSIPLTIAIISASIAPGFLWKPLDPHPYDVLSYHLQIPREWYDAGRIIPLAHNAFSYFPMLMETHYLAAMHVMGGPWKGMYLCQFISLAHGGLAVCAVAAILLELGSSKLTAWSAALITASVPWVMMLSTVCYVEPGVMLYGTLGLGWILLGIKEKKRFVTAGLCFGLACGFKYTAFALTLVPTVASLLLVGLIARNKRWVIGSVITLFVATCIASPWLIRNVVWTGNPVFPLATGLFGKAHFTEDQVERYRAAHRPPDAESNLLERVKHGWDRTIIDPQFGYVLIPAAILSALLGLRKIDPTLAITGLFILISTSIWLLGTHDIPRFLSPMIPILVLLLFLGIDAYKPITRLVFPAIAVTQLVLGLSWLWPHVEIFFGPERIGVFLLPDYTAFEDAAITRARLSNQPVDLVGDGQAFFYVLPSKQLHYRSVFDVNIAPGQSLADGWLGESVEKMQQRGDCVIVRPDELDRLAATYKNLTKK